MDSDLFKFFQQDKDLVTDTRPLRLRLAHATQMLEDVLLPQQVSGTEAICGSLEYRILCVSLDAFIPLKELIALPVAVDIVTDRGDLRSICGIVTEACAGDSDGGLASYQLVIRDALAIMEKRTNTRVFRNRNEMEIVAAILDEWRTTNPIIGTCFSYQTDEFFCHQKYPPREFTMQYNESDAAFIRRLLKRRGISWYFRAEQSRSPEHTMMLFNHPHSAPPNAAGTVRYHRDAPAEERDTVTSWCAVRTLQPATVSRFSWDYKRSRTPGNMFATAQGSADQGESGNDMAASLDDYQILSPHVGDCYDDLCLLGKLAVQRHDFESKCFHGEGSVRDMRVGEYFTLEGHPEIDSHRRDECDFVVTAMALTITNNLNKTLAERVQRLFTRSRWAGAAGRAAQDRSRYSTQVQVSFTAVRRGIPIVPAFDARTEVPNVPMQSAIVVGPGEEEVYCDALGRVKIRFRATRAQDHKHAQGAGAANTDMDSAWVRVASNWAGSGPGPHYQCGSLHLPRVGSEVLIAFLAGDPDRPIIIAQTFNEVGPPPAMVQGGSLPGNRYISGVRSREIRGSQANYLRFDDTTGEIGTQLASDCARTELNLGHITVQSTRGARDLRGIGAELKTEESVAIRGANGVLLTTESNQDGPILLGEGLVSIAHALTGIAEQLSDFNRTHSKDDAITESLQFLLGRVKRWVGGESSDGKAILAGTSAEGILFATSSSAAFGAEEQLDLLSARDIHMHAGHSAKILAMKGITLFSHEAGMKFVSAEGEVQIQSQHGDISLSASGKIRICAGEGIELVAPEVKIASKGGQADFGPENITHQCKGEFFIKSSAFSHTQGGNGSEQNVNYPSTEVQTDERVYLYSSQSGKPVAGRKYLLELSDGRTIEGVSDAEGRTELVTADEIGEMKITIFPDE